MGVSLLCDFGLLEGFLGALNTIASKPEHDKVRRGLKGNGLKSKGLKGKGLKGKGLNGVARIAIVDVACSRARRFRHDPDQQPVFR
jgi:hypothetical protein